jgi:hypothetical protein
MKPIDITPKELEEIRKLHTEKNRGMPVSFSTNSSEQIWLSPEPKPVPHADRVRVEHQSKRLDEVAKTLISCRSDRERAGGKFFINWEGAFWKDENATIHRFVSWNSDEPLQIPIEPMNRSEMLAQIAMRRTQKRPESRRPTRT